MSGIGSSMLTKVGAIPRSLRRTQILTSFGLTGLQNLRRYFELMVFQSYLQSIEPDTMQNFESFESFVENRPGTSRGRMRISLLTGVPSHQDVREGAGVGQYEHTEASRARGRC